VTLFWLRNVDDVTEMTS